MAAPGLGGEGPMSPSWASSSGSIISAWDKGAGVENPIVGPRMEISLIYSPRLPQAFCPRLFVSRSQLMPRGVSGCLAELEGDGSPMHWALLPRANPQLLQEERRGRAPGSLWRTGQVTCLSPCTHYLGSCSPSTAGPPAPRPRHRA